MARSARVVDAREQPEFVAQSTEPEMPGIVECIFPIEVVSYHWNCPKYTTPRYTGTEVEQAVAPLRARIAEREARLKAKACNESTSARKSKLPKMPGTRAIPRGSIRIPPRRLRSVVSRPRQRELGFDELGCMKHCYASIRDRLLKEGERKFRWELKS